MAYLLFPRSDIAEALGYLTTVQWMSPKFPGLQLGIGFDPGSTQWLCGNASYNLAPTLDVESLDVGDCLLTSHDTLRREGMLDHPFEKAELNRLSRVLRFSRTPDGNSAEVAELWANQLRN